MISGATLSLSRVRRRASVFRLLVLAVLALVALYQILLTASTALSYNLHYPFMDQFRTTLRYLTMPFPDNVLALENGHRPILPGLIRVLEFNAFSGWPVIQAFTAWFSAIATGALLLWRIHRDLGIASTIGATAATFVISLLYWNANARMFIHAYEAVHIFYISLFVVLALLATASGAAINRNWPWFVAVILCIAATFTFGPGIASFCAIAGLAILRRRFAVALGICVVAVLVLIAYATLLPGDYGVRENVANASPALTLEFALARIGAVAAEILRVMRASLSIQILASLAAGLIFVMLVSISLVRRRRQLQELSQIELVGIGMFVFGCVANLLIAVSRTHYFAEYPGQLFADRYLFWSCFTWVGGLLYGMSGLRNSDAWVQVAGAIIVALLCAVLFPAAIEANDWASSAHQISERQGISSRLGLRTDQQLEEVSDADLATTYRSLDEMRRRHLNLFAGTAALRIGDTIPVSNSATRVRVEAVHVQTDEPERIGAMLVSGVLPNGVTTRMGANLWLASLDGKVVGRAALTHPGAAGPRYGRIGIADLSGFEGYMQPPLGGDLFLVLESGATVMTLARLVPAQ